MRSGGYDLIGFPPFSLEIKRCETLSKRDWWLQVVTASDEHDIPVVMYRQNGKKWKFLISAAYIGVIKGFIELEEREFILWAKNILKG